MSDRPVYAGDPLSLREIEVRDQICLGKTTKEIAEFLNISPRTVEVHRSRVFTKTGAGNAVLLLRLVAGIGNVTREQAQ